mmetsp:Transcript_10392/g.34670  ORF Transcript_10392/g.34670 Transcript_10392/m.34670 type:complete len:570 (-) Transcript_10392:189-1898(-)
MRGRIERACLMCLFLATWSSRGHSRSDIKPSSTHDLNIAHSTTPWTYLYKVQQPSRLWLRALRGGGSSESSRTGSLQDESSLYGEYSEHLLQNYSHDSCESFSEDGINVDDPEEKVFWRSSLQNHIFKHLNLSRSVYESCDEELEEVFIFQDISGRLKAICKICKTSTYVDRLMSNESKGHYVCPWTKFFICIKHLIFSKRHISLEKQKTYFSLTDKQQSGLQKTLFAVIKLMSSITTERLRQSQAFNDIQWSRSHLLFMLNVVPQDEEVFSKVSKDFKVQQFLDQCLENPRIPPLPDFRMSMMKKKDVFTLFHIDVDVERDRSWNSTRYCCFCTRKASWGLADNQSEWRLLLCSKCKSTSEAKLRNVANCNTDVQKMIFFLQNQHLTTRSPAAHRGSKSDRLRKEYSPALTVGTEAVSRNPPAKPATRAPFKPKATVSDSLDSPGWRVDGVQDATYRDENRTSFVERICSTLSKTRSPRTSDTSMQTSARFFSLHLKCYRCTKTASWGRQFHKASGRPCSKKLHCSRHKSVDDVHLAVHTCPCPCSPQSLTFHLAATFPEAVTSMFVS